MTDKVLYIDKLGNLNEVPLIYQVNNRYQRKAFATLNQDGIICGIVINGSVIKDFGSKPFFNNITEFERYLCSNSTNTHSKIPTIYYRVAGVPIEFNYINPFFFYEYDSQFKVEFLKFTPNHDDTNFLMLQEIQVRNESTMYLQKFDGLKWVPVLSFYGLSCLISITSKEINVYRLYSEDFGTYSEPIFIEPEKLLSNFLHLTN